ncbi:ankyrin repeat domain-containing protein [Anaerocolumna sp. AGMB13025]|uniref:ankyrin repeat domain-containing protein n=1 Tax=Anaerocolumna sp. AGMB13025 TaxID=3039116 RepID=UPI00241CACA5|nr:ankyrin repeat domain-containing protein [Anaerocolumna sp. AGMB13025]WFR59478.1 ankyrin repeat domain-containing protein [Anaerocolumna sp. AGMB13025]
MGNDDYDIIRACAVGDIEYVRKHLEQGINPNSVYKYGWTPLICAVENEQKEIVELLLKSGADVNFQPVGGWTALHQAVDVSIDGTIQNRGKQGDEPIEMIKYLLDNGADITLKNGDGRTPLDIAKIYNSQKVIMFLINYKNND